MEGIRIPIEVTLNELNKGLNNATNNIQKFAVKARPASIVPLRVNTQLFSAQVKTSSRQLVKEINISSANAMTALNNNTVIGLKRTQSVIKGFSSTSRLNISVNNSLLSNELKTSSRIFLQSVNNSSSIASANVQKKIRSSLQNISSTFTQLQRQGSVNIPIKFSVPTFNPVKSLNNIRKVFAQNLNVSSSIAITNFQKDIDVGLRNIKSKVVNIGRQNKLRLPIDFIIKNNPLKSLKEWKQTFSFLVKNPQMAQSLKSFDIFGLKISNILSATTKNIVGQSTKFKSALSLFSKSADLSLAKAIQPGLDKLIDGSKVLKVMKETFNPSLYRSEIFGNKIPSMASVWAENINKAITSKIASTQNAFRLLGKQSQQISKTTFKFYNNSVTGQVLNSAMGQVGENLGINVAKQSALYGKAIQKNYNTVFDYILNKLAIVAKASKDKQYTAGIQMYKSVLVDVGGLLSKGFNNQGLKSTATYTVSATQGFLGLRRSMLGMLTTAVLIGQVLSRNFWVNLLTPIGDIQQYLVAGLIPNIATITQMVGIINRYSAGPLLTQARYASVVRWLGIGEKVLASMTNKAGQLYSSFKGVGLASKLLTVPAKMSLALMDMVNTLRLFNTQLQAAIVGASTLGNSIVESAENLLSGGGFLMPGMMAMGPTATTMFQIDQGIESAVNFDQLTQMFGYATSAAGATREEIDKVRMSILEAGDSSTLTLQQIADGMTELAVGGNDIGEIKKTFDTLSKVSLTTGVEIPQIADPLGGLASAYEVEDFESMSFAIGKIAISTGTSVIDIANSLTSLQPVAKDTNAVFEDMAILVTSLMSDTGRTASQVTAGIRSVYSEIEKASSGDKEKQKVLSKLGISLEEVQIAPGYLRPIDEVIQTIRSKVSKASKEGKDSYGLIYDLLGSDLESKQITSQILGSGKSSDSFVETTRDTIGKLSSAKSDIEGAVSEQADTFTGKLQRLTNATFAVSVSVGRMFQPFFEVWVDGALSIASWFNHLSDGLQRFGISLQALLPIAILYFKAWTLHGRVVTGLTTTYTLLISLLKEEGRVKFLKDISKDFSAIKEKMKELGQTTLDILSGKGSLKQAGADLLDFIRKIGKANFDDLTSSTMETTRNLLMPVDAFQRWLTSLTRVNVSFKEIAKSAGQLGNQVKDIAIDSTLKLVGMKKQKDYYQTAINPETGEKEIIGFKKGFHNLYDENGNIIKERLRGSEELTIREQQLKRREEKLKKLRAGRDRTNAYKMAMGYQPEQISKKENVYENMNFAQGLSIMAVQIGLVTAAWYTLTELFKRSEGAKIAEETKKLNKELQETYKTTGLISKDKSFTEIGKGLFSSIGGGFGKIQEFYSQIDILTPLENQLGRFEQSLMNTKKKDFTPKIAPIEQTITAKQAGKAVLDLFVDSRKGPTTKPVDPTNLQLGSVTINKASTQDFTNKLNLLIVKSFVIQKSNAIQQWATGVKDEVALGLVRGAKATVGFVNEMKSFVNNLGSEVGKFKDKVVTGLIDGVKTIYNGTVDYIKRIKEVGLVEASREKLSADPKSSFGNDASVSGLDVANGLGMVAGSMTGLLIAASVLGIALNPLGLVVAGLASAFVGLTGILKGAWKTAEQAGNIESMLAKDELLKTTDISLESSQNFLNKYGISNKADLAQAKERLTPAQKAEIEAGTKSQIDNLQSAINTLEKTKSASPEEKAITETRIKLYQDEVNRLRHREGVIKGTIALNEKLVYSYKELNDEIAKMNYNRELTNSFNNAKYEKQLVEDPDKLINGDRIVAKERAKMREDEIRGNIKALAEEKRKLSERTNIAPRNEEEAKEYEAAKKRLTEIDIEYNKNVTDLAKSQQDEMKRLSQERVDDEIAKFNKLNAVLKQQTTQKEIGNEFAFGLGAMDKDQYGDNQSKIKLDSLFAEKKLLEDELKSFIELNRNKDFSNKDLAQKKIDLEQKISDTTLQIIQERNSKELDLTLRNIRIIAAEKSRALQNEARNKEFDENDLNRRVEVSSTTSDVEKLSMERGQKQLEYQLQIAELMNDETKAIQLREQLYASQLNMKLAEIAAQKELLALQSEAKMVSAERTAIESELAVIESESALAEAIANKETEDVIARLEDELSYKQRLVENSYQNISSAEQLASLEQQKLQLTEENEIATLNEARSVERLREQTESVSKAIEDVNKQLKEQQDAYKQIESAKKLANQEKLLSLAGTGGFDIASTLMDNELAVSSLNNEISLLQGKLEQLNGLTASAGENKEISGAILETEKELADKVLEQQLTILGQQIEFKKQLTSEVQLQLKAMEEHIAIMEKMGELEVARNQEVKARLDYYSALLDIQKQVSDKVLPTLETGDIDSLLDGLKAQETLQKRIDYQRIETLRTEQRIALSNLDIEERKAAMAAQRQRAELRNNVLLARDAVLQADQSGDAGAIAVTRQQLDIANQALSNFEHQESLSQQINRSKRATLETENKSLMVQEKANQKAEKFSREQEKINAISRNITNEIDKQQKKMQSIADLNKAISDYRINALEKESSRIDDIIGMRKELGNENSEMPDTLRKELTLQMESMKKGSSTQSEKSLYAEKLNIEQRLAKERYRALLAEQAMEKAMFDMETRKLGLEMRTAEMQAKIIAMQAKGTELERPANELVAQAGQANIDFEKERSIAKKALDTRQAMDRDNLAYDNTSKINETRRAIAEAGYTPEGKPAVFKPSDFIVPTLVVMDESLKQVDKSILKFEEVGSALDVFTNSIEGLAQRIDQIQSQTTSSLSPQPNTTIKTNTANSNGPGGPGGPGASGTVINVASVSVISSDPTGDARKVLTDLTKANKNK